MSVISCKYAAHSCVVHASRLWLTGAKKNAVKTPYVDTTKNPKWDPARSTFGFAVHAPDHQQLVVALYDYDGVGADDEIGRWVANVAVQCGGNRVHIEGMVQLCTAAVSAGTLVTALSQLARHLCSVCMLLPSCPRSTPDIPRAVLPRFATVPATPSCA